MVPPEFYVDRESELGDALGLIDSGQSFLLVGDRRAGKTSFIRKLIHQLMARPGNTSLAVYLNVQQCLELRVDTFLREALDNMVSEIARQVFRCKYTDLLRRNPADADPVLKDDPVSSHSSTSSGRCGRDTRPRGGAAAPLEAPTSTCSSATCST